MGWTVIITVTVTAIGEVGGKGGRWEGGVTAYGFMGMG